MKTVIEMATEAYKTCDHIPNLKIPKEFIERLVELARADEREACAKVCEENATDLSEGDWDSACINCADHIRARSNT